jgi:hypothetical protein
MSDLESDSPVAVRLIVVLAGLAMAVGDQDFHVSDAKSAGVARPLSLKRRLLQLIRDAAGEMSASFNQIRIKMHFETCDSRESTVANNTNLY